MDVSLSFVFNLKSKSQGEIPAQQCGCNCFFFSTSMNMPYDIICALSCEENTATRLQAFHVEYWHFQFIEMFRWLVARNSMYSAHFLFFCQLNKWKNFTNHCLRFCFYPSNLLDKKCSENFTGPVPRNQCGVGSSVASSTYRLSKLLGFWFTADSIDQSANWISFWMPLIHCISCRRYVCSHLNST